jgi:hypothetical protein
LHAVRVAARLRRELQTDIELVHGQYGEFKVLIDGEVIVDGGSAAFLGILPSTPKILATIRARRLTNPVR